MRPWRIPERTVVCWNGSAGSEAALSWALRRSRDTGSTIRLFDVVEYASYLGDDAALDRATAYEESLLDSRIDELGISNPGAVKEKQLLVDDPLDALTAQTRADTLVIVGTRHRTGPRFRYGWSLGSRLATAAEGPVAIVPAEETAAAEARSGVVVGIDGSEVGRLALEFAAAEAEALGQPLKIVHCWTPPPSDHPLVVPDEDFLTSQAAERQELLKDHERTVSDRPGLEVTSVLRQEDPVAGLRAESEYSFMLVVGSRRLTAWRRSWIGSVSHGLIIDLAAPTVVVGHKTRESAPMS